MDYCIIPYDGSNNNTTSMATCEAGSSTSSSSKGNSKRNRKSGVKKSNNKGVMKLSTDPQSVAARERRHRISDRFKILQSMVPGGSKMDTVSMLEEAIHYVKFLKTQIWLHQTMMMMNNNNNNNNNNFVGNNDEFSSHSLSSPPTKLLPDQCYYDFPASEQSNFPLIQQNNSSVEMESALLPQLPLVNLKNWQA